MKTEKEIRQEIEWNNISLKAAVRERNFYMIFKMEERNKELRWVLEK